MGRPSVASVIMLLGVAGATVVSSAAESIQGKFSKQFNECMDRSDGVTANMRACILMEYAVQDKQLNNAYQALLNQHAEPWRARIRDAQRKWIAYRDAACPLYAPPESGTLDQLIVNQCFLNMVSQRAGELNDLLQQ